MRQSCTAGLARKPNVVNHIAALTSPVDTPSVRPTVLRILVAIASLLAGVFIASVHRRAQQRPLIQPINAVAPSPSSEPAPEVHVKEENYPEDLGTGPYDIARFIREHPSGKLENLWQRLGISGDDRSAEFQFRYACSSCETNIFKYNLDNDAAREVVLQIKEDFGQSYRYLVFKYSEDGASRLLGHIDVSAKYPPADPVVLVSNGRAWLIVQGTAATGSGLGAWVDTVYDVSNGRVRPVAVYLAEVNQSGDLSFPSKRFVASPQSCEMKGGRAVLTLAYTVEYSAYLGRNIPLFTKRQRGVLIGSLKDGSTYLDPARSDVTTLEHESIYNFDSMSKQEFLKYNYSELRALAVGNNSEKKKWLLEFLNTCERQPLKRKLLALLR